IQDAQIAQHIRKRGPGTMVLMSSAICRGTVTVERGRLSLSSPLPGSIDCNLFVGDGDGAAGSAEVTIDVKDQIADHVNVVVRSDGRLVCTSQDQIFNLDVTDGLVSVRDAIDARLTVRALNMTGGIVETQLNGQLRLLGDVTAIASAAGPALMRIAS